MVIMTSDVPLTKLGKPNHAPQESEMESAARPSPPSDDVVRDLVQMFKLLADDTRLRILFHLMQEQELNVRSLCEILDQSQPAVSHHLALLRVAGLIESRRDGKHNFYRIIPKRFQELLELFFANAPSPSHHIQLDDYVLSYEPVEGNGDGTRK